MNVVRGRWYVPIYGRQAGPSSLGILRGGIFHQTEFGAWIVYWRMFIQCCIKNAEFKLWNAICVPFTWQVPGFKDRSQMWWGNILDIQLLCLFPLILGFKVIIVVCKLFMGFSSRSCTKGYIIYGIALFETCKFEK